MYSLRNNQNLKLTTEPVYSTKEKFVFDENFIFSLEPELFSNKNKVELSFVLQSAGDLYLKFEEEKKQERLQELTFNSDLFSEQIDFGSFILNSRGRLPLANVCQYKDSFDWTTNSDCISFQSYLKQVVGGEDIKIYLTQAFKASNENWWNQGQKFEEDNYLQNSSNFLN